MGKFFWSINFDIIQTAEVQGKLPVAHKFFWNELCDMIDLSKALQGSMCFFGPPLFTSYGLSKKTLIVNTAKLFKISRIFPVN